MSGMILVRVNSSPTEESFDTHESFSLDIESLAGIRKSGQQEDFIYAFYITECLLRFVQDLPT